MYSIICVDEFHILFHGNDQYQDIRNIYIFKVLRRLRKNSSFQLGIIASSLRKKFCSRGKAEIGFMYPFGN